MRRGSPTTRRSAVVGRGVLAGAATLLLALTACSPISDPEAVTSGLDDPAEADEARSSAVDDPTAGLVDAKDGWATLLSTTTTVGFELPVPEPLPLDAYEPTPEQTVGAIAIPGIGVDEPLHVGMTLTALNRGPSMWPGTALPGDVGNLVVAAHRTTYGGPFRDLDQLVEDDTVVFTDEAGTAHTYAVTGTRIVEPEALHIADQSNHFTATLFACHPPGSAAQRIVVDLHLVDADGEPVPPAR